jgi:methenyltetrahydromethanopterin cyclohydrolase
VADIATAPAPADLAPITHDELTAIGQAIDAIKFGHDNHYDRNVYTALAPKYRVFLATVVCSVCHYATPENNRVASGDGVAHAKCPERPWEVTS